MNLEVPDAEKESVEKKKITTIHNRDAIQGLVLRDLNNDILFEGYKCHAAAAAIIDPVFQIHTFCIPFTVPLVGLSQRQQDRVRIHPNTGFLGLYRFLEFRRKGVDAGSQDTLLRKVEHGFEKVLQVSGVTS